MSGMFYIVSCALASEGGGIYRYQLDERGIPRKCGENPIDNSNWLAFSPDRGSLYATCTVGNSSGVTAYRVNPDMSLKELNCVSAEGQAGCYVCTDPGGQFLFCANYMSGCVTVFSLNGDGSIRERLRNIQHTGEGGPNVARQDGPHTHYCKASPDGKYLIVIDLGIDAVKLYPFDVQKGIDEDKAITFDVEPAGSGPRHIIFNRAGTIAYLIDELGNTVHSLAYDDGQFKTIQIASILPEGFDGVTKAAAIRLSEDEKFLFASNRGYDSIAVLRLDGKGGMAMHDLVLCGGESPRDVNFLPGMKTVASANEFADTVFFFDYCADSGKLTPNGQVLTHKRPLAITWSEE